MSADAILAALAPGVSARTAVDGVWADVPGLDVREMARWMAEEGARFVAVTAQPVAAEAPADAADDSADAAGGAVPGDSAEGDADAVAARAEDAGEPAGSSGPETPLPAAYRLTYHWDDHGLLVNLSTEVEGGRAVSIVDICPAADWTEREICDYYSITFDGSTDTRRLMVLADDEPGFFDRTRDAGHDADPAQTSYRNHTAEKEGER